MQTTFPLISVIMPVYNAELYLAKAIESVLNQTFSNFEFIICNDGSTDSSEEIIKKYSDARIVYTKNEMNLGLIQTLNNAVQLAKGKFIARMDNDDICYPNRFERQLNCFEQNPKASIVCSPVQFINGDDLEAGFWHTDKITNTSSKIYHTLPWENCIAHPTIMILKNVLVKYLYSLNQKGSEDWDLWLRLSRDGHLIVKTSETLLKYRIHADSYTQLVNSAVSPQIKSIKVKLKFSLHSLAHLKINWFVLKTGLTSYKDLGYYIKTQVLPVFLKKTKWFFTLNPFLAYYQYKLLKNTFKNSSSSHFFFFPYSHIGGAEKVHAEITIVAKHKKPLVFITGLSDHSSYIEQFGEDCVLLPVAKALYHPLFASKSEKLIQTKIHAASDAVVFGCNNLFFYNLLPKLNRKIYVVDLTHDYNYVRDKISAKKYLPTYIRCNARLFISNAALQKTVDFYKLNYIEQKFVKKLHIIYNSVNLPLLEAYRSIEKPYRILYVGRDTPEKRVDLLFELANICQNKKLPIEFILVGPIRERKHFQQLNNLKIVGEIKEQTKLSEVYQSAHFIAITSASEGFPLTLAEGMAHRCIPISTAVGDIPFHIRNEQNGFLIDGAEKDLVLENFTNLLVSISGNTYDLKVLSQNAYEYCKKTFDTETFVKGYSKWLKLN